MQDSKHVSRRNFLSRTAAGIGSLSLVGGLKAQSAEDKPSPDKIKKIITRTLGRTGLEVPVISMGVMNASVDDLLASSYEIGVRHFDTAWIYQRGNNERMVGKVIKQMNCRKDVIIGTKIHLGDVMGKKSSEELLAIFKDRFEESLDRLQTDYVDILYFHDINNPEHMQWPELQEMLTQWKAEKKILATGISCHSNMTAILNEAARGEFWDVILFAYNFAMVDDQKIHDAIKQAADKGIGLVAMKTQAGGDWYRDGVQQSDAFKGLLNQTAMLKWVLSNPHITTAVPGYTNYDHLKENFSVVYDLAYTSDEKKFLEDRNIKLGLGYCHQCGECKPSCPKGADVPTLMRTHMYAYQYHNLEQAHDAMQEANRNGGLNLCMDCETCTAQCTQSVAIKDRIASLKTLADYRWA
ncbi:aldo/keto reductase [candidate division KSB1 bacterium]|nr:aldo/keto reductase [candidate division KSB1 bacterium]